MQLSNQGTGPTPDGAVVRFIGSLPYGFQITSLQDNSSAFTCEFANDVQIAIEPEWALFACASTQQMQPGEEVVVLVNAIATSKRGRWRIDVKADDQNEIAESDEQNNLLRTPFMVQ